jgi:hypothetical protein
MFNRAKKEPSQLDDAIAQCYAKMSQLVETDAEYAKVVEQLVKLHKLKMDEKSSGVSPDTLATIAANIAGILLVIRAEHVNIITSRAMSQVMRLPKN